MIRFSYSLFATPKGVVFFILFLVGVRRRIFLRNIAAGCLESGFESEFNYIHNFILNKKNKFGY